MEGLASILTRQSKAFSSAADLNTFHLRTAVERLMRCFAPCVTVMLVFGCAAVPPESVDLSRRLGAELTQSQAAHLSTLDAFYKRLREDNDQWIKDVYLPSLAKNAAEALRDGCRRRGDNSASCSQLNNNDMTRILAAAIDFRDELSRALSTNRDTSVRLINEHYVDLQAANSAITALLASVVDLKKSTKDSIQVIGKATGIEIDTDKIEQAVSDFLTRAGQTGSKVSELEASLSSIVNPTANKQPSKPGE